MRLRFRSIAISWLGFEEGGKAARSFDALIIGFRAIVVSLVPSLQILHVLCVMPFCRSQRISHSDVCLSIITSSVDSDSFPCYRHHSRSKPSLHIHLCYSELDMISPLVICRTSRSPLPLCAVMCSRFMKGDCAIFALICRS